MAKSLFTKNSSIPDASSDSARIAQELYRQNLELAEHNRTLSILRAIDQIALDNDDVSRSAAMMVEAIIDKAGFPLAGLILGHPGSHSARPIAIAFLEHREQSADIVKQAFMAARVSKGHDDILSEALSAGATRRTSSLDRLLPALGDHDGGALQNSIGCAGFLVCPLAVRDRTLGLLVLGTQTVFSEISEYRRNLIRRLSDTISVSLDNALLYRESLDSAQRLRRANSHLRELDVAKDEFISMASHQLRTPLTTIKGYLSMLTEGDAGKLSKEQLEFVGFALTSSERMVHLISDLLNASRLTTGKFMIEYGPANILEVIQDEVRQLQTSAKMKNLQLILEPPATELPEITIDENKTRQVIMNFIDNAIYYTQEGSVTVRLARAGTKVRVEVTDTGIGVPPDAREKLFSKFFRADNARSVRPDGTGLGLYLAKRVIEDQGGTIIFESEVGRGSTFGFELPIRAKETANNG